MFRIDSVALASLFCVSLLSAAPAAAAQDAPPLPTPFVADADLLPARQPIYLPSPMLLVDMTPPTRPSILPLLYASFVGLQAYDGYVTISGTAGVATETNPLLHGFADNQIAVWAVKGGAAFVSIYAAERLWKQRHRGQAVAVMVMSNAVMAAVAARNVSVTRAHR